MLHCCCVVLIPMQEYLEEAISSARVVPSVKIAGNKGGERQEPHGSSFFRSENWKK